MKMLANESEFRVKVAVRVSNMKDTFFFTFCFLIISFRFDLFYNEKKVMNKKVVLLFIHKRIKLYWEIEEHLNMILSLDQKLNR